MNAGMTPRALLAMAANGGTPPRLIFAPTVYEHAAGLIGRSMSDTARCPELLAQAQLAAFELYRHDIVTVGLDIYNVEAEAAGCRVEYPSDAIPHVAGPVVDTPEDLKRLRVPDPQESGRMPVMLAATGIVMRAVGRDVPVSAAMAGPFTLAAILRGFEDFLCDIAFDPEFATALLDYSLACLKEYGYALARLGAGIAVNESWAAPPLLSPKLFRSVVLPYEQRLIAGLKRDGAASVSLVCGGNTTKIANALALTGTSLLMADFSADRLLYKKVCENAGILLRASIESAALEAGGGIMLEQASRVIREAAPGGRFVFGCGIVSPATPPKNVLELKEFAASIYKETVLK